MLSLYALFGVVVFAIGVLMVAKHYKGGWMTPPVLSGIAFILLTLPSILSMVGIY